MAKKSDSPYQRFLDARNAERKGGDTTDPSVLQALQKAYRDELRAYSRPGSSQPFPPEMASYLGYAFEELLTGHAHPLMQQARRGAGEAGRNSTEASCIEDAILYIRAARMGIVKDNSFIKTILENYGGNEVGGLSRDTVVNWDKIIDFKELTPDATDPELIEKTMIFSGRFYCEHYLKATKWRRKKQTP